MNFTERNIFSLSDTKCSAPFVEKAIREECSSPYLMIENAVDDRERCRLVEGTHCIVLFGIS